MGWSINRRAVLKTGVASMFGAGAVSKIQAVAASEDPQEMDSGVPLPDHAITHGGVQRVAHPRLRAEVDGQTCIRLLRFGKQVELDHLELGRLVYGRATPRVPTHPAHVQVSVLNSGGSRWKTICDVELPFNPRIAGEGLSQSMSAEEMDALLAPIVREAPHRIELGGLRTDHLRVVCDREHAVWPNHGECNGGEYNPSFGILNELKAYGRVMGEEAVLYPHSPPLKLGGCAPTAPEGMSVRMLPQMVLFESEQLSLGFSLRRPMIMHLGWDTLGSGQASNNRALFSRRRSAHNITGGVSGPILRTVQADYPPSLWTGEVSVEGNRVTYSKLSSVEGFSVDAVFTVEADRFMLELTQRCDTEMPVLEMEAWRLAWDLEKGITGLAAMPTLRPGRNGDVRLPALWATDGVGCLSCRQIAGETDAARLQLESYRESNCVTGGIVFGEHAGPDSCQTVPAGEFRATFEFAVTNLVPDGAEKTQTGSEGLRRHWATVFACFRPEFRGFSNHSASVNCHLSQGPPIEIVARTRKPAVGPDPIDLARYTVQRALLDGGGYGYFRNLYLDSDPILLSAAGRVHQARPDMGWLRAIAPGLLETVDRILGEVDTQGLLVCKDLSGNLGSYRWSSNSMDVVGFGHIDAYVNAWAYRGLRNAVALLSELTGYGALAEQCRQTASRIREQYALALLNPDTGWVAGWRSRDGQLHDYGFTWVNGVALAFGLLDDATTRTALQNMEHKRATIGLADARLGIPCNLLAIRPDDQMWTRILKQLQPTFETYTDGSLSGWPATYYLRALSIHGLKDAAQQLAGEMAQGYAEGVFNGGNGEGSEFRSWEGLPTGYEGTLIGCFGPVYALAIEEGLLQPSNPEWWPENG